MPSLHKVTLPECESPSNTESDRDPNTDELPSKPVEGGSESSDEEPPAGEGLSEEVYEVEKILNHKETDEGLFYLVHWKGFTKADDSWEPVENLELASKAIEEYEAKRKLKCSKKGKRSHGKAVSTKSTPRPPPRKETRRSIRQTRSAEKSESEPEPEIPSDDGDDEDFEEKIRSTKRPALLPPKGSGTITKAALKSYSPTAPKARGNVSSASIDPPSESMTAAKKDNENNPEPMQALLLRQSWLYDSDSDDESGTEKENDKKLEHNRQVEDVQQRVQEQMGELKKLNDEVQKTIGETQQASDRKRKSEETGDKKKKTKVEKHVECIDEDNNCLKSSPNIQNGGEGPSVPFVPPTSSQFGGSPNMSVSETNVQEEVQIYAIGKVNDGRIRVVIGNDQAKKVVSLRDAHDANSWGLLQHLLQYAVFDDYDD